MHVELMRVSGAAPERLCGGDDSSENSSESSCYEVMDTNGEIVHMAKRLTCRVGVLQEVPFQTREGQPLCFTFLKKKKF